MGAGRDRHLPLLFGGSTPGSGAEPRSGLSVSEELRGHAPRHRTPLGQRLCIETPDEVLRGGERPVHPGQHPADQTGRHCKAAIGEEIDNEELGGALVQCDISGVVDHRHPDDASCIEKMRSQFAQLAAPETAPFGRRDPAQPLYPSEEIYGLIPADRTRPYETREVLARLLDGSDFDEYKTNYGETLVCGTGWIEGWAVGIVANQRSIVSSRTGTGEQEKELQIGGVIYSDSADKGARFVDCSIHRLILQCMD